MYYSLANKTYFNAPLILELFGMIVGVISRVVIFLDS